MSAGACNVFHLLSDDTKCLIVACETTTEPLLRPPEMSLKKGFGNFRANGLILANKIYYTSIIRGIQAKFTDHNTK